LINGSKTHLNSSSVGYTNFDHKDTNYSNNISNTCNILSRREETGNNDNMIRNDIKSIEKMIKLWKGKGKEEVITGEEESGEEKSRWLLRRRIIDLPWKSDVEEQNLGGLMGMNQCVF